MIRGTSKSGLESIHWKIWRRLFQGTEENSGDSSKDKVVISHSRNSSDSSGYHEASVLSDNPDSAGRLPETLPRRNKAPLEMPRKLAQTSQSSKSLSNLASVPGTLSHGISSTSLSSTGVDLFFYLLRGFFLSKFFILNCVW